ncbi:MAG: sugar kinase [Alteromonas sp.]|jgi:2-dehydro-3-deoxygluconokinase|uniref:sugar kinase n=1 Tax=Alteromonas sp. TaxID=232 RepID=UPI0032D9A9CA
MKKICFMGECMVELRPVEPGKLNQSFAGDVYNSAVYLTRCFGDVSASMLTAVGSDRLSNEMMTRFKQDELDTSYVFQHETRSAGLYLIETDKTGERSFTYWRSESAAKQIMSFITQTQIESLSDLDQFVFSGISIAIIEAGDREAFWQFLNTLKSKGVQIVFDPNYRARLWKNESEAVMNFDRAFELCDVTLAGVEDLTSIYGVHTSEEVLGLCQKHDIDEIIVKDGPSSVISWFDDECLAHAITPVSNVVDTTSAGDAFNGVYLGARLSGSTISDAISLAAKAAGIVIQHPGAIVPKGLVEKAIR